MTLTLFYDAGKQMSYKNNVTQWTEQLLLELTTYVEVIQTLKNFSTNFCLLSEPVLKIRK